MGALRAIKSQLAFFTVIPVRASYDDVLRYSALAPLVVGPLAGIIDWGAYYLLTYLSPLATVATLAVIETFRGFNHLDGLLDFGDALMIRGSREDKLRALKDVSVGAGGVGLLLVYVSLSFASLVSARLDLLAFLSVEVSCRALGISLVFFSRPMPESSMGKAFKERALFKRLVLVWPLVFSSIPQLLLFLILFIVFRSYSERALGGVNGDVAGAAITLSTPLLLLAQEVGERFGLGFSLLSLSLSPLLWT